ncbi:hypothetical protein ACWCL1_08215 [Ligilactobacillus sp. LYQ135]
MSETQFNHLFILAAIIVSLILLIVCLISVFVIAALIGYIMHIYTMRHANHTWVESIKIKRSNIKKFLKKIKPVIIDALKFFPAFFTLLFLFMAYIFYSSDIHQTIIQSMNQFYGIKIHP